MTTTPKVGAPELSTSQASKEVTHNEGLRYIEQGGRFYVVKDKDLATPPGSPADGDAYIVAGSPTGAWAGWADRIAFRMSTSWEDITPEGGVFAWVQDENKLYYYNTGVSPAVWSEYNPGGNPTESFIIAASDETTALTTGTAKVTFRIPYAFTLTAVRGSLTTAQTSGAIFTVDVNEGGTSVLSTKLTIDNGEKTSTTAATPPVISDASLADDAEVTIDIDQVGDGTAKGLKVILIGAKT